MGERLRDTSPRPRSVSSAVAPTRRAWTAVAARIRSGVGVEVDAGENRVHEHAEPNAMRPVAAAAARAFDRDLGGRIR